MERATSKYGLIPIDDRVERLWKQKWAKLLSNPDTAEFRLFSRYIGADSSIVPEEISVHHRLIAQDICITADGSPRLVEFNIEAFSSWFFQFTIGPAFGEKTDEIIEYCAANKKKVRKVKVEPF